MYRLAIHEYAADRCSRPAKALDNAVSGRDANMIGVRAYLGEMMEKGQKPLHPGCRATGIQEQRPFHPTAASGSQYASNHGQATHEFGP